MNTAAAFDIAATRVDPALLDAWNAAMYRARNSHLRDPFAASRRFARADARWAWRCGNLTREQYLAEVKEVAKW